MAINNTPKRTKPLPRTRRNDYTGNPRFRDIPNRENRGEQIKRSDDKFKNIAIGLQDIDEAIIYFFKNVIKPRVIDAGLLIDVPVQYGDPEMWNSVQVHGYARDKKGKIIAPVVMYRRTGMSKDNNVPVDKADRNILHTFPKKHSNEKNKYDRFSLTHNIRPTYEMFSVVVPDYVILTYECAIWTSFIPQMNKIIEQLQYWEGSYWGDEKRFLFQSKIDSFDQNVEVTTDKGRMVRSNFSLEIKGFLIPEIANDLVTTQKTYSKQQIILDTETEVDVLALGQVDPLAQKIIVTSTSQPAGGANETTMEWMKEQLLLVRNDMRYLRALEVYSTLTTSGSTIVQSNGNSIASYPNVYTASLPAGSSLVTDTNEADFLVFVNGQYMEHDAMAVQQSGSSFIVTVSTGSLGYALDSDDEIVTWGKFDV